MFSSNAFIQMRNGLEWLFSKSRADVNSLSNPAFKDKILEYRSLQGSLGPSNISVVVGFVTNGLTSELSVEFQQEAKTIVDHYDNGTFHDFDFGAWGADELVSNSTASRKDEKDRCGY